MDAWVAIGLRFAAYCNLMLLAGLALGGGLGRHAPAIPRRVIGWAAAFGMVITVGQFGATCLSMTGNDMSALDREMLVFMAFETPMGLSHIVRAAALGVLALLCGTGRVGRPVIAALAVIALGSLAWSGHAGASEAALGWLHRASDIAHLIAAAIWIAALVMLVRILLSDLDASASVGSALAALERFSSIGAVIVGVLVVTGSINLLAIVGIDGLPTTLASAYGRLLVLKLALFGAMLGLAGLNRWRFVPAIGAAARGGEHPTAARWLRRAILAETMLAFFILATVAILGTLSPLG